MRVKGITVEKSIIYGTEASLIPKKSATEQKTHTWTCYVRGGTEGEDISPWIKKVIFRLHSSFENPTRVVQRPPFEITDSGWGEFEIAIRIYFTEDSEECVDLFHTLALYSPVDAKDASGTLTKPVISERRDEIVFNEPTFTFYKNLLKGPTANSQRPPIFQSLSDADELSLIQTASAKVRAEIMRLRSESDLLNLEAHYVSSQVERLHAEAAEEKQAQRIVLANKAEFGEGSPIHHSLNMSVLKSKVDSEGNVGVSKSPALITEEKSRGGAGDGRGDTIMTPLQ